jgi:hypothetical protein
MQSVFKMSIVTRSGKQESYMLGGNTRLGKYHERFLCKSKGSNMDIEWWKVGVKILDNHHDALRYPVMLFKFERQGQLGLTFA